MADKSPDDLEAVRAIVASLEPFEPKDRDRVLRWACEKLGIPLPQAAAPTVPPSMHHVAPASGGADTASPSTHRHHGASDIRSFMEKKSPRSDVHFTAAVAYYYAFEAPAADRREEIGADDLLAACRLVNRGRPPVPGQTMLNAHNLGYLDKGSTKGLYRINSVGENLVAMVLPNGTSGEASGKRKNKKKGKAAPRKTKKK
jgi:hypothetical protein